MKNGKKPTLAQKKFLQGKGLVPENWLIVKEMTIVFDWIRIYGFWMAAKI